MRRFIPDPAGRPEQSGQADPNISSRLAFWLGRIRAGESRRLGAIEITPLIHDGPHGSAPLLLHDALAAGSLEIVEQGSGVVNTVLAHNKGDRPVLILEGESIVGAKQNRVVTVDVLLAAGEVGPVFVGCVEQGRWHHTSSSFKSADVPLEPSLRSRTVSEMAATNQLDQGRLWKQVEHKLARHAVRSSSSDYHDFVAGRKREADAHVKDVPVLPGQVGVIALLDGHLLGMDVLGHPDNWASLSERLLKAYVLAGMDAPAAVHSGAGGDAGWTGDAGCALSWLQRVANGQLRTRPAVGLGVRLGISGPGITGGGLWWEERPAHLAVFGTE